MTRPGGTSNGPWRRRREVAALGLCAAVVGVVALLTSSAEMSPRSGATTAPPPAAGPTTTVRWGSAALPYAVAFSASNSRLGAAARREDLPAVKSEAGKMADDVRAFRLALEGSGAPPAEMAVEARAVIEGARDLEGSARAVDSCLSCLLDLSRLATSYNSFNSALGALTSRMGAGQGA